MGEKMTCIYVGKKPELKPNRKINNYIQEIMKMQGRGAPCEGLGGRPVTYGTF